LAVFVLTVSINYYARGKPVSEAKKGTSDRILDAALELFVQEGFEETPMDAVAERAGVAKGTLYYHYKSKEGIVDALVERYASEMKAKIEPLLADSTLDFANKYESLAKTLSAYNHATLSRLHKIRRVDIHQKTALAAIQTITPLCVRLIEDGARAGACKAEGVREFVEIHVAASQFLLDPEYGRERLAARAEALDRLSEIILGLQPGTLKAHGWTGK
jgi:AcrR family transcriptional regulator